MLYFLPCCTFLSDRDMSTVIETTVATSRRQKILVHRLHIATVLTSVNDYADNHDDSSYRHNNDNLLRIATTTFYDNRIINEQELLSEFSSKPSNG